MTEVTQQPEEAKGIAKYDKVSNITGISPEVIAVIHNSVAKGTSVSELSYFLNVAKAAGLNPFMKEVWCYKDNAGNLLVFTGRDGFLKKAQQSQDYKGIQSSVVFEEDEFEMITDTSNNEFQDSIKIIHKIKPKKGGRGVILGAFCIAYREDKAPYGVWVEFARYNKGKFVWAAFPEDMIVKVAEAHCLKKAFGITGLSIEEDFNIDNGVVYPMEAKPQPVDKSKERLEAMINDVKTKVDLEKLATHCTTPSLMQIYENKLKEFA